MPVVFTLIAATLALCATALLTWALIGDRAKGRRRCPKCWYNLAGVPTISTEPNANDPHSPHTRCPECGHLIRREHHTHRTRRRWRWALASIPLFALAYASLVGPAIVEQGARAAIPTLALLYGPYDLRALAEPDLYPEPTGRIAKAMFDELKRRLDEHRLTRWQSIAFQRRLRAAYAQIGRLGVPPQSLAALRSLESTPCESSIGDVSIEQLRAEVARAGLYLEYSSLRGDRWCFALDPQHSPSVFAMLDAAVIEGANAWTVQDGRVSLGTHGEIAEHTRYEVFDLHEVAAIEVYWDASDGCFGRMADGSPRRRLIDDQAESLTDLIQQFIDPHEWIPQGGRIADIERLDEMLIVRARPSTLVNIRRLLDSYRVTKSHSLTTHPASQDPIRYSPSRGGFDVRWHTLHDLLTQQSATFVANVDPSLTPTEAAGAYYSYLRDFPYRLIDHIQSTIDPDHWQASGGEADMNAFGDTLLIATTPANHQRIEQFLTDLKSGRAALPPE